MKENQQHFHPQHTELIDQASKETNLISPDSFMHGFCVLANRIRSTDIFSSSFHKFSR